MLDGVKKLLPAGTYPCQWRLRGQTVSGELTLEPSQSPVSVLFDAAGTWVDGENSRRLSPPHSEDLDVLRGWTRRGEEAVLIDVTMRHLFPPQSRARAQVALVGHEIPEDLLFNSAEFQVGGLTELSGVRPLKEVTWPRKWQDDPQATATWNSDAHQQWTSVGGDDLELQFTASMDFADHFSFSITSAL